MNLAVFVKCNSFHFRHLAMLACRMLLLLGWGLGIHEMSAERLSVNQAVCESDLPQQTETQGSD